MEIINYRPPSTGAFRREITTPGTSTADRAVGPHHDPPHCCGRRADARTQQSQPHDHRLRTARQGVPDIRDRFVPKHPSPFWVKFRAGTTPDGVENRFRQSFCAACRMARIMQNCHTVKLCRYCFDLRAAGTRHALISEPKVRCKECAAPSLTHYFQSRKLTLRVRDSPHELWF